MKCKKFLSIFIIISLLVTLFGSVCIAKSNKKTSHKKTVTVIKTGRINKGKVITINGKRYLSIDLIRFYWGAEALKVAKARGDAIKDDDGSYYVEDGYYTVDEDGSKLLKYQISIDAKFYVCAYQVIKGSGSPDLKKVSFNTFKKLIRNGCGDYYKITLQNNSVIKVQQIFVP